MTKKQATTFTASPHDGTVVWIGIDGGEERGVLVQAILRGPREIAIDCQCDGNIYTMILKSIDGIVFSGECRGRCKDLTWFPDVSFKRWTNQNGSLFLGSWIEEGYKSYCVIELTAK